MGRKARIIFWILFPLLTIIFALFSIFYLDLADGPLILFILFLIYLVVFVAARIILRNKKFVFRLIPTAAFVVATGILFALAHPVAKEFALLTGNKLEEVELVLKNGKGIGLYDPNEGVEAFGSIPYAKAPLGELRWKEPQEIEDWKETKDFKKAAKKSMQPEGNAITSNLGNIYASKRWAPYFGTGYYQECSEDSLYLNIYRPHEFSNNLPILVYIHGGSLTTGSSYSTDYQGIEAAKQGVITVTVAYRLGIFGYFAHSDLIDESPNHTTGNYGLLDQIMALRWINENASYFGGDKDNITIAGESAGSSSVSALCTSPLAKGLFKRAIGESSSLVEKVPPHTYRQLNDALETGDSIMKEFKCRNIDELRGLSAKKLLNSSYSNSSMTLDGYALTKDPYQVYLDGENNEEALLNGYNVLEADAFVIPTYLFNPTNKNNIKERLIKTFDEEYGNKLYEFYHDEIERDAFKAFNEIFSIYWFIYPHHSWSIMAANNGVKVYRYQFTKTNHFQSAYHYGEVIYAYGNIKHSKVKGRYDESDVLLSEKMCSYWMNFVKTGNPNSSTLETWDEYRISGDMVMELGEHVGMFEDKYLSVYPLIEGFMDYQLENMDKE